jgi:lipopolysaccharide export system protein LptA
MRWQKRLRFAIAAFVVVFAAIVVVSLRRGHQQPRQKMALPANIDPKAVTQGGAGEVTNQSRGQEKTVTKFGKVFSYADGRSKFTDGVTVTLPDKDGRRITIHSQEAQVTRPPGKDVGTATFTGGVTLTTSDGITVKSDTATYADQDQTARIPGRVTFTRGRMSGAANGATYDETRHVLWLLDAADVTVKADEKGEGAMHVTSKSAGMARLEHYMKFTGAARLDGEGHIIEADEATAFLTQDDEKVQRMELRGNARISGKPGSSGPQEMHARDIDAVYGPDGRSLQTAHLVENALIALPGDAGKPAKRIAGKIIDVTLAPDGATVTNLTANENVQVDLPADGETPARRIRSASLLAAGTPTGGIQSAAFVGNVDFRETRPAKGNLPAIDRAARSQRLDAKTKPGFGDLETAQFQNNVHFTDGTDTAADAPFAVYSIAQDRMDLTPGQGNVGKSPHVSNGRISVEAKNIQMTLTSQRMKADTAVRSLMQNTKDAKDAKDTKDQVKVPSILKQDKPVNVRSNKLDYDGDKSIAIYDGNARLWQDDTDIKADRIMVEDKTGNLHATTHVVTRMTLEEASDKPDAKKPAAGPPAKPTDTTADDLLYEDDKHRATYTGSAHMKGPDGDVTADKIELYLAEQGGQLERAEAEGNVVSKQENRRAFGRHLTYLSKDDLYTMVGLPAKVYDDVAPNCKFTEAATVTFRKEGNTTAASGAGAIPQKSQNIACGTVVGGSY